MEFISIPKTIRFNDLMNKKSLSPANYQSLNIKNNNKKKLKELIDEVIVGGKEVGSSEYIEKSNKYFIRTKAFKSDKFLIEDKEGSVLPIKPQSFIDHNLKKGDVLILKDSNVGEAIYLDKDYEDYMMCGAIKKINIKENKLYTLAFIKNKLFKDQLNFLIGKGATIKHAGDKYLECEIPFPNGDKSQEIIAYVETLVEAYINKEKTIKEKYEKIYKLIDRELFNEFEEDSKYEVMYSDLVKNSRCDAGFYSKSLKKINKALDNYSNKCSNVYELGFTLSRGQNLQVSAIGESLYTDIKLNHGYSLYLPTNITEYGTISKVLYLGNKNSLKCLEQGDLVIGAEGFEKGRSVVIVNEVNNVITNIHGVILKSNDHNLTNSIFLKCFLDYLRTKKVIDKLSVGGNGGSLALKYWDSIRIPNFNSTIKEDINSLYYNTDLYKKLKINDTLEFKKKDEIINKYSGILQLDEQIKEIKNRLKEIIDLICKDENIDINFNFKYLELN